MTRILSSEELWNFDSFSLKKSSIHSSSKSWSFSVSSGDKNNSEKYKISKFNKNNSIQVIKKKIERFISLPSIILWIYSEPCNGGSWICDPQIEENENFVKIMQIISHANW